MSKGILFRHSHSIRRLACFTLLATLLIVGLAACNNKDENEKKDDGSDGDPGLGLFEWDKSPETIIFRVDDQGSLETPADLANDVPLCTLWGDGRLVWVNVLPGSTEVLEARISDDQIRGLVETIIRTGFYDWENDILQPDADRVLESITLNLYESSRTVERYSAWPVNGFEALREVCAGLSEARALVVPTGGWMNAYEVELVSSAKVIPWPRSAPFTLAELATSDTPRWVESPWAEFIWTNVAREGGIVQVREDDKAYVVSLQVPGVSRDAPPAPVSEAAPASN
jgi:hypothetical protein